MGRRSKASPFQGRWLGDAETERSCREETTSQSPAAPAPLQGEPLVRRILVPSPMRGRWHGEAVTDEVEALLSARHCPPHQSPCGDSFPSQGKPSAAAGSPLRRVVYAWIGTPAPLGGEPLGGGRAGVGK